LLIVTDDRIGPARVENGKVSKLIRNLSHADEEFTGSKAGRRGNSCLRCLGLDGLPDDHRQRLASRLGKPAGEALGLGIGGKGDGHGTLLIDENRTTIVIWRLAAIHAEDRCAGWNAEEL
jgi:hypothetical protein